jgi:hypothetical protein
MLTESIKKQIEVKYGHAIRYPKDCENLAIHITSEIKSNISASTLKRLFGFVKSESKPMYYFPLYGSPRHAMGYNRYIYGKMLFNYTDGKKIEWIDNIRH